MSNGIAEIGKTSPRFILASPGVFPRVTKGPPHLGKAALPPWGRGPNLKPMQILVIDRESLTNQLIAAKLEAKGHIVKAEPNKNLAFDMIKAGGLDCVMVDPAPLSEARPV